MAQKSIAAALSVEVQDHFTEQGVPDLSYEADGLRVVVEVKRIVDHEPVKSSVAAAELGYIESELLERSWCVRIEHRARIKRARPKLPALLARLEALDWRHVGLLNEVAHVDADLHQKLTALGVHSLSSAAASTNAPGFQVMPRGSLGAVVGVDAVPAWVSEWTATSDADKLRRQLRGAHEADERHAFLAVGPRHPLALPLDRSEGRPSVDPVLADPIDGVWITTLSPNAIVQPGQRLQRVAMVAWLPNCKWIYGPRAGSPTSAVVPAARRPPATPS